MSMEASRKKIMAQVMRSGTFSEESLDESTDAVNYETGECSDVLSTLESDALLVVKHQFFDSKKMCQKLEKIPGIAGFELLDDEGDLITRVDLTKDAFRIGLPSPVHEMLTGPGCMARDFEMIFSADGSHHVLVGSEERGVWVHAFFHAGDVELLRAGSRVLKALDERPGSAVLKKAAILRR